MEQYKELDDITTLRAYLGIDIGSTSTKAMLTDQNAAPIAGFYTYTAGQPVNAVKAIFESITTFGRKQNVDILIVATGTTGSTHQALYFTLVTPNFSSL